MTIVQILGVIAALFVPNVAFLTLLYTMVKEQKMLTKSQHEKTVSIEAQVKNTHSINLREDIDDKHAELLIKIGEINQRIANIEEELYGGGKTPAERRRLMEKLDKLRAEYIDMKSLNWKYSGIRA